MIQLFSNNTLLKNRFKSIDISTIHVNEISELDVENIIVTDSELATTLVAYNSDYIIFALTPAPNFQEGTALLAAGIKGYANSYIHAKHLRRAITTIKEGNIWLPPSFMQELIAHITPNNTKKTRSLLEILTKRQRETALLIKEGLSNKEVAKKLNITERTVKAHLSAIFERTGATDRLTLAMLLSENS